jgi:hypothetical protein
VQRRVQEAQGAEHFNAGHGAVVGRAESRLGVHHSFDHSGSGLISRHIIDAGGRGRKGQEAGAGGGLEALAQVPV